MLLKHKENTMKLRDYFHFNNVRRKEFAQKVGYNYAYICRVASFHQKPSKRLAESIEHITGGQVTVAELLDAKYEKKI
jgi:DNA-binding transcriptional regulator YdaS (Cro superfamily)